MKEASTYFEIMTLSNLMENSVAKSPTILMPLIQLVLILVSLCHSYHWFTLRRAWVWGLDWVIINITTVPPVSILIDDEGVTPVAGLNYSLACKVSGIDTTVTYTWRKDDAPLSEVGPILSFSSFRLSDTGEYSCAIRVHDCSFKRTKNVTIERGEYKLHNDSMYSMALSEWISPLAVFQPDSVTLISDPTSPLGVAGSNVTVICATELSPAIDVPVNVQIQLTDPDGGTLATTTETSRPRSMANYTINSFRREQIGVYTCIVTFSSPTLQESVITKTIHIHVGKLLVNTSSYLISILFSHAALALSFSSKPLKLACIPHSNYSV